MTPTPSSPSNRTTPSQSPLAHHFMKVTFHILTLAVRGDSCSTSGFPQTPVSAGLPAKIMKLLMNEEWTRL